MSRESERRRPTLDEAIDRVVARMTSGAPRPDLGRRVVDGIETAHRAGRVPAVVGSAWQLALVATSAAVVVIVVTTMMRVSRDVSPPVTRVAADRPLDARPVAGSLESARDTAGGAATSAASTSRAFPDRPRTSAAVENSRRGRLVRTRELQGPPLLDPVGVEAIGAPSPLRIAALSPPLEALAPAGIDVEPLTLDRLDERLAWPPDRQRP